jgi:CelD/BcsL family acetyltransferase involved in cellulose biosynthesis
MTSALASAAAAPPATALAATGPISVEMTTRLDLAPDDQAALDLLLAKRPEVAVFLSRPWLSGFFSEPPDAVAPALVLLRQGSALRGIVPIAVRERATHTTVSLLGGSFGSDRVDLVAACGFETAASDAFIEWLCGTFGSKGFVFELRDAPSSSALWGAIHRAIDGRTLRGALQPRDISTLPYLDLKERPSALPEGASTAASARSLDKHRRWLERRCRLRIEVLDDPDEVVDAFGYLASFLHARWAGTPEGSALDDARTRRFHERALPLLLRAGSLRMVRLSADAGKTIAVFYGMASGPWWGYYLCGYDREWAGRIHLGQVTLDAAIGLARQHGAAEFDFLKGAHRNKYAWPVKERTTLDVDLFSDRSGPQLRRAARATRDAAAALAKSARGVVYPRRRR